MLIFRGGIMKIIRIGLICSLMVVLISCQKDETETDTETITRKNDEAAVPGSSLPSLSNDYLVSIYEAQELIKIQQDDIELRRIYCEKAYLPEHRIFVTMGIARLHHPGSGVAIPDHLVEKAARLDAIRWASYGKEWMANNYEPPFGQLQTNFQPEIEIINRAHVGDSLFVFIAARM